MLVDGRAASKITQGITTEVTGEGSSIAPLNARMLEASRERYARYGVTPTFTTLAGYFEEFERRGVALNLATFVGAGGVRNLVIGLENRPPTPDELRQMEAAVAQAMEEGALGLSTSLIYVPDNFASTDEIIALAKVAARYGGSYATHQRDEEDGIDQSLDEVFRVAREARIPAEIYHLKTASKPNWGRMPAVLKRLEAARAEGLDIRADQYPWTASSNDLDAALPVWVREGGAQAMVKRLTDPATRARVRADFLKDPLERRLARGRGPRPGDERPQPGLEAARGQDHRRDRPRAEEGPPGRPPGSPGCRQGQHGPRQLHHARGRRSGRPASPAHRASAPIPRRGPKTGSSPRRSRTRGPGAPLRASWASTCARRRCSPSRRRSAR